MGACANLLWSPGPLTAALQKLIRSCPPCREISSFIAPGPERAPLLPPAARPWSREWVLNIQRVIKFVTTVAIFNSTEKAPFRRVIETVSTGGNFKNTRFSTGEGLAYEQLLSTEYLEGAAGAMNPKRD